MPPESTIRRPKPAFEGRNGYTDAVKPETELDLPSATDRHRSALYILNQRSRAIPSLQEMKDELAKPDDLSTLKERMSELRQQHLDDLQRMYASHAEDYFDDAMDRYLAKDDSQYLVQGENNLVAISSYAKLDSIYNETRKAHIHTARWDDDMDRFRYAYLRQILSLQKHRADLEEQEAEAQRRRDSQFPRSIQDYRSMRNKDMQFRVARLLTSDRPKQEAIMNEFGWAWRQVQPLKNEFDKNGGFKAEIQAQVIEAEVRDPRKKYD